MTHRPISKLCECARDGNVTGLEALLREGAASTEGVLRSRTCLFNSTEGIGLAPLADDDGVSPLMWAADSGQVQAAAVLLTAGADINQSDIDGYAPTHQRPCCCRLYSHEIASAGKLHCTMQ